MNNLLRAFLVGVMFILFMTAPLVYTSRIRTPKGLIKIVITWAIIAITGGIIAVLFVLIIGG